MRTAAAFTALAVIGVALVYYFTGGTAVREQPRAALVQSQPAFDSELRDKLDQLTASIQHYRQTSEAQSQQMQMQQTRLDETLGALSARVQSLETAAVDPPVPAAETTDEDTDSANPKPVSEAELSDWMDGTLQLSALDRDSTQLAMEKTAEVLAQKVPDIELEDMQCGDSFCRATFTHLGGEVPDIGVLFGEPPFVTEGFTVERPDGRVMLYFTQPGESLEQFRDELQAFNFE